ncbi:MAG: LPS-assembly protein LptD, partial [Aestuariivirgaceae bacterium]
ATGNVYITYGKYVLVARKAVYDQRRDILRANGEVRLTEPGGNILEADIAQLQNKFRDGFAEHLRLLLTNDATMTADYAQRRDGNITVYTRVAYTRCKDCVLPNGEPLWQLKSQEATHNQEEGVIYHKNASMEFAGIPVFWLPELSHPDPTNKRHSGFLIPNFLISDSLGFGVETPYFWDLAPNYDITFRPLFTSKQGPFARAEWRHRLDNGQYSVDAGGIYQFNEDALPPPGDRALRGFVRTQGDFRINNNWTWGWDATAVSDDTVMRRYKIDDRTDIASVAYLTGIDDRNYFTARAYHFQGLLTTDSDTTFPIMAPYIRHNYVFDQTVFGGEVGLNSSVYSIYRERATTPFSIVNHGTDQTRIVNEVTWEREMIGSAGQIVTPFTRVRSDLAITNNVPDATVAGGFRDNELTARVFPTAGVDLRWPFIRGDGFSQQIFTPVVQVVTSTNERKADRIGNEDAITLNFDHSSLFLHDRFTGTDRFEGGTRVNAGLLYTMLFSQGGFLRASIGESFHVAGRNSFATKSGLESTRSDLVAALALQPFDNLRFTSQARFDQETFDIHVFEAGVNVDLERLSAAINYSDLDSEPAYGRPTKQRQVWASADLKVLGGWSLFGDIRYDFEREGQIRNRIGIGFDCDCFDFRVYYKEDFTNDGDVEKEQAVLMSIEFKTLGSARIGSGI